MDSKKPAVVEAAETRKTARKRLFDSGGKTGVVAQAAERRRTRWGAYLNIRRAGVVPSHTLNQSG